MADSVSSENQAVQNNVLPDAENLTVKKQDLNLMPLANGQNKPLEASTLDINYPSNAISSNSSFDSPKRDSTSSVSEQRGVALNQFLQTRITALTTELEFYQKQLSDVKREFSETRNNLEGRLEALIFDRERLIQEMQKLRVSNENLIGKRRQYEHELQQDCINLPNSVEECHTLLLKYVEELVELKSFATHAREELESERYFAQEQNTAVRAEAERRERALRAQLTQLREQAATATSVMNEFEHEAQKRRELEARVVELQAENARLVQRFKEYRTKASNAEMLSQQERQKLGEEMQSLHSRLQHMQQDLDNSESVQRDFVRLSQSLQVELEKIRASEREVRWQFDDDVAACSTCSTSFSNPQAKKHCLHCGKIFCGPCLSRSVSAGPARRPAPVCAVCYTLLVRDSTPYFSELSSSATSATPPTPAASASATDK